MPETRSALWLHDCSVIEDRHSLVGVDEAGRGSLAGPVMAAAVYCEKAFFESREAASEAVAINDSKQVKPEDREQMAVIILGWRDAGLIRAFWAAGSVDEIAEHNILGATRLAMKRSLEGLDITLPGMDVDLPLFQDEQNSNPDILVDGRPLKPFPYKHTGLVKGDGKSFCIAAASILAKVHRDRLMAELCQKYPQYGFSRHKGYATNQHCNAIREVGPCPEHRELFLRKIVGESEKAEVRRNR
ncbi:ribonuclease HII [Rubellicoccus peritrichatus]|uniref:Ribonuclease n=1 Tax=Rubellicoccus peritrichatus TaxID=3080537 RepID=A0AAQ3LB14_9BACT|nr:ribonuclease HII [Puniceicoccus sp. CR14]WOO42545.1 ribonuclease HII [Puniceicoccus sp. CR14]